MAPDLAVQVVSLRHGRAEHGPFLDYLEAGAREVGLVDPFHRTVTVHRAGGVPRLAVNVFFPPEVPVSRRSIGLDEPLHDYMLSVSRPEPEALRRLREETAERDDAEMQIAPEQARLMALLVKAIGARRTLELGVFTGYSAAAVALALPEDGRVVACEVDPEVGEVARRWWGEIGVAERIDLRIGPALETLDSLLAADEAGAFDFAFIDADKREYVDYWERCVRLVRSGGLIAVDNVFRRGTVADPADEDPYTVATRAFNAVVMDDDRVELAVVPIADGVTLALVR